MKTLANCKPSEFLVQTNKIRKAVDRWLTDTDIINIRKRMPVYEKAASNASADEKVRVIERNAELDREQTRKNLQAIFDAMLDEHPEETLEILALCCFVDPAKVDDYPIGTYLRAITDLITDEAVLSFFSSLASLGQSGILNSAKA